MGNERYLDDTLVRAKELAKAMLVSPSTVYNWKVAGYIFQFGQLTTPGHCKAWHLARRENNRPPSDK
jgi:hypothetical protein